MLARSLFTISKRRFSSDVQHIKECFQYCVDQVRKSDFENYLAILHLPDEAKGSVFTIRAWNLETASIKDYVREPIAGMMRIQWWVEIIELIYQKQPPKHPVAQALAITIDKHNLPKQPFLALLEARDSDIRNKNFADIDELSRYGEFTHGALFDLTLACLGVTDEKSRLAAHHAGRATAIALLLKGVPYYASKGKTEIPQAIINESKLNIPNFLSGQNSEELTAATFQLACSAKDSLNAARQLKPDVPSAGRVAFLPTIPIDIYLNKLQKVGFNVLDPSLYNPTPWDKFMLQMRLLYSKIAKTY